MHIKKLQADFDSSRKTDQKITANLSRKSALRALKSRYQAEIAMLQGAFIPASFATVKAA